MTASGMWPSPLERVIAARPTASPSWYRATAFRQPAVARSPGASAAAAAFPSQYPSAHPGRAAAAASSATRVQAGGAGLFPATGAAASGRPRGARDSRVPDAVQRLSAAPQSRDQYNAALVMGPGSAAHHAARHSASKTRVNALMALRCVRGTECLSERNRPTRSSGGPCSKIDKRKGLLRISAAPEPSLPDGLRNARPARPSRFPRRRS
jgi:hypothetical protein